MFSNTAATVAVISRLEAHAGESLVPQAPQAPACAAIHKVVTWLILQGSMLSSDSRSSCRCGVNGVASMALNLIVAHSRYQRTT